MKKVIRKIKQLFNTSYYIERSISQMHFRQREDYLVDKILNCKENGISKEQLCESEVIVSLTTYGKRIFEVSSTIESIMQGSIKPNRIILWLSEDLRNFELPKSIINQINRGLEIDYCDDIRSYKKLVPSLKKYPNSIIITVDDDLLYNYDLVEKLINTHKTYPNDIIANRMHKMILNKNNRPVSYMKWDWCVNQSEPSSLYFFTGGGGTLYPPNSLDNEVVKEHIFMDICKYADDIWFNAMALKAGTKVRKCYTHNNKGEDYLINENVQDIGLCKINTGIQCENDIQLKKVFDYYNLWEKLI